MCAQRVQLKTTIDGQQVPLNPYTDCVKNVRQQMPLAGSKLLGTTVLYVGPTTDTYSTGVCYTCKATESSSYYWEAVASGGGEYTLTKEAVDGVIGASAEGSTAKFYNEQGSFTEVDMSGYLPTTGGDMTGNIRFAPTDGDFVSVSSRSGTYNNAFHVGINSGYGAHLNFYSNNYKNSEGTLYTELAGGFRLTAYKSGEGYQMDAPLGNGSTSLVGTYNGLYWNDVLIATVNDIATHNTDTTAHADLLALKVDAETYNTAITEINTSLEGKENIGVAQGLVDAHNESATAHEVLFEEKADKTELENYLPLTGGTMTGGVLYDRESAVSGSTTSNSITVNGGQGWGFGGSVAVYGSTHETRAGQVIIRAYDGTDEKRLEIRPDGTFKFDGQSILNPIGTVIAFAGNSAPDGYLICNGAAVSRTTYAKLFAVIGTTYGAGDGSTTFNLPNLTDKFIMGSGTAGTSKAAGLPNITGDIKLRPNNSGLNGFFGITGAFSMGAQSNVTASAFNMGSTSGTTYNPVTFNASVSNAIYGNSTTVQPPALTMIYCIKY